MPKRFSDLGGKLTAILKRYSPAGKLYKANRARAALDWAEAACGYQAYLQQRPADTAIHVQLGHALKESGNLEAAADAYRRALLLEPEAHEVRLHLAHCLKNAGALDAAVSEFARLLSDGTYEAEASVELCHVYSGLGDLLCRQGKSAEAIAAYSASVRMKPEQPAIWVQLGHALKDGHRLGEAAAAYRSAADYAPGDPDPWLHLAHLLRITGPRQNSVAAFARTWLLGNRSNHILEALRNAVGYRAEEVRSAIETEARALGMSPRSYADGLGDETGAASIAPTENPAPGNGWNIIYLSAIDWGYRRQRPQQMARKLGAAGCNIFFVSTVFDRSEDVPGFRTLGKLADHVTEVRLQIGTEGGASIHIVRGPDALIEASMALARLCEQLGPVPIVIIDHPAWWPVCEQIRSFATIVYDCIDEIGALPGARPDVIDAERRLIASADVVTASSRALLAKIPENRGPVLVPNGVDTEHFANVANSGPTGPGTCILYFGMIADWFNPAWIEYAAKVHPEWTFHLVGEVVTEAVEPLRQLPNVQFLGEVSYEKLPDYLRAANATIIPFHVNELTQAVNPVKVYEYLSAGRPVVASAIDELRGIEWVRTVETRQAFESALADEIAADTPELRQARSRWAAGQDWSDRCQLLLDAIEARSSSRSHGPSALTLAAARPSEAQHDPFLPFDDFVLFVAPFPKAGTVVEGWMGRIRAVDEIFVETPRIYLNFSTSVDSTRAPDIVRHAPLAIEVFVHPTSMLHAAVVQRAMTACRFCYVQTVHLAKYVAGYLSTGKLVTDFHGIVPEEEAMLGNPEAGRFYEGIECAIVHGSRHIVVVTQSMADHLRRKYPYAAFEEIVLPIIVEYPAAPTASDTQISDHIKVIYSGGSQVWQNIDLMLDVISRADVRAQYFIASHDYALIREKSAACGLSDRIDFDVYNREQLPILYESADFGFVLRDDSAVNRVACPTKLTEYLEFGVIPIVKLAEIGDFAQHGYEFVTAENFAAGQIPTREERPRIIAKNKEVLGRLRDRFEESATLLKPLRLETRIPCTELAGLPTYNHLGLMPWKREVYIFGDSVTYVAQSFLNPYETAHFSLPANAKGDLIRVVPLVGDFIARIEEIAIDLSCATDIEPTAIQSRGRRLSEGDVYCSEAPFLEIRLSRPVEIKHIDLRIAFIDNQPMSPAISRHILECGDGRNSVNILIRNGELEQAFNMIPDYIK